MPLDLKRMHNFYNLFLILIYYTLLLLLILKSDVFVQCSDSIQRNFPPRDGKLNFTSLATEYGHPPVEYEVITEDGYILTLYHLPGKSRFPVFLLHGLLDSSDTWVLRGEHSLAITLANDDYDVWLGNSRGNRYSRRHVKLNPDTDAAFWKFSFNEVGYYDLPAFIDKILNETGADTLTAIGHSQGNTAFYVLGATRPEYNKKINVMIALAPICYLQNTLGTFAILLKISPIIEKIVTDLDINEFLGDNDTATAIFRPICAAPIIGYEICAIGIVFPLAGFDITELEPSFYQILANHFPAGTSSMSVLHFLQVGRRKKFAQYDYGVTDNNAVYNCSIPPVYDLSKVTMPIALLAARNDYLSTLPDVARLKKQLPNVVYYLVNPRIQFNHADDVTGRRMYQYLFPFIYRLLRQYNGFD